MAVQGGVDDLSLQGPASIPNIPHTVLRLEQSTNAVQHNQQAHVAVH